MLSLCARRLFAILAVLLLTACGAAAADDVEDQLSALEAQGILNPTHIGDPQGANFTLYEAQVGVIAQDVALQASLYFPVVRQLYFARTNGYFSGVFVQMGDRVQAGDVLAELHFDNEALEIEREIAATNLRLFETRVREDEENRRHAIEAARFALERADEDDWVQQTLDLQRLEIRLAEFLQQTAQQRQHYINTIAQLDERIAPVQVIAPFAGVVTFTNQMLAGTYIRGWPRLVTVVDDSIIRFSMQAGLSIVRFGDVFPLQLPNGGELDVRVISDPLLTGRAGQTASFTLLPTDEAAVWDFVNDMGYYPHAMTHFTFTAVPHIIRASGHVVIDSRAVHSGDDDFVYIYYEGQLSKRYITTGAQLGNQVEILSGIDAGERVVIR